MWVKFVMQQQGVIESPEFSSIRSMLWPIRSSELAKFLPMASLIFTIWLNQNIVRSIKDSLIITQISPEVISYIKLWLEMPIGVLFVVIYTKMCNVMTTEKVFRIVVVFFILFFTIFAYLIYPIRDLIHPSPDNVALYSQSYPHVKWFIALWGKWSFTLYYVMGELWPVVVSMLLFWQLANKITRTEEAKRFYSFFCLFGQISLVLAGVIIQYFVSDNHIFLPLFADSDSSSIALKSLSFIVCITGIATILIHRYVETNIIEHHNANTKYKSKKLKLGIIDSAKIICNSRYLGLISILMISYSITVSLIEGLWFSKVHELHTSLESFMSYQATVLSFTGLFAIICAFLGSNLIRRFGWFWGAIATPLMIAIAGSIFFISVVKQDAIGYLLSGVHYLSPLFLISFIGGMQNVLGKGVKYSLFDATKEMVYIPLDSEIKTKGKAAVDVVGPKIGKSLGAIIQCVTFTVLPDALYNDIAGMLMFIFLSICIIWIFGVTVLSQEYSKLLTKE